MKAMIDKARNDSVAAYKRAEEIVKKAEAEGRNLSDEEHANIKAAMVDAKRLSDQAVTMEDAAKAQSDLAAKQATAAAEAKAEAARREEAARAAGQPRAQPGDPEGGARGPGGEPQTPAQKRAATLGLFKKFLRVGVGGLSDVEVKAISSRADDDGGYVIAEEFRAELITELDKITKMRAMVRVIPINVAKIGFPTISYAPSTPTAREGQSISVVDVTNWLGKTTFEPHKRGVIFKIPKEWLADAVINGEQVLIEEFATAFREQEETDLLSGTGKEMPLGILKVTLNQYDSGGATNATKPEDFVKAPTQIPEQYRANGRFLLHRETLEQAMLFRADAAAAADKAGQFLWIPSMGMGMPATLAGFPYTESEFFPKPSAGADGDAHFIFGDFKNYWLVERLGLTVERLMELYAEKDQIGVKMTRRQDGAPVRKTPFVRCNRN